MPIKNKLKKIARCVIDIAWLGYGLLYYLMDRSVPLNQRTPTKSYLAMIRLFCVTSGRSNDLMSKIISLWDKPIKLSDHHGILGNLLDQKIKEITSSLEEEGYYIFDQKLPQNNIQSLYDFALKQECCPRRLDGSDCQPLRTKFDRNNIVSSVYDIPHEASVSNPTIQTLLHDHSILAVAQSYLKTSPKAEPVAFWWSAPFLNKPQAESAQLFHFDMDRIKWIKFFIFLTDVTLGTGPHVFVRRSHRTKGIPKALLKAGYARHQDEDINKHYSREDVKIFTVPAGTILAEDTRGLHKGTHLMKGERLVLEFQFSNCLFGAVSPSITEVKISDDKLTRFAQENPKIYQLYPMV